MKLRLKRTERAEGWTAGELWADGEKVCDTLEDRDRGLTAEMGEERIRQLKVRGETAIPCGRYAVAMDVVSNKYRRSAFMLEVCGARVPRLRNVPGFEGILIHTGNTAKDTEGCVLVGVRVEGEGRLSESRETFRRLYGMMKKDADDITITIE